MKWVEEKAGIDGSGMVHFTWGDTATLSFPSFVFNFFVWLFRYAALTVNIVYRQLMQDSCAASFVGTMLPEHPVEKMCATR